MTNEELLALYRLIRKYASEYCTIGGDTYREHMDFADQVLDRYRYIQRDRVIVDRLAGLENKRQKCL